MSLHTAFLRGGASEGSDGAHLHCTYFVIKDRFILAQQNGIFHTAFVPLALLFVETTDRTALKGEREVYSLWDVNGHSS